MSNVFLGISGCLSAVGTGSEVDMARNPVTACTISSSSKRSEYFSSSLSWSARD